MRRNLNPYEKHYYLHSFSNSLRLHWLLHRKTSSNPIQHQQRSALQTPSNQTLMNLVHSREEFDAIRPYKTSVLKESEYPTSYPVIIVIYEGGGGLMGEYTGTAFAYPPEDQDINTFYEGFKKGWKMCQKYDT
jgi:hypothetical protein